MSRPVEESIQHARARPHSVVRRPRTRSTRVPTDGAQGPSDSKRADPPHTRSHPSEHGRVDGALSAEIVQLTTLVGTSQERQDFVVLRQHSNAGAERSAVDERLGGRAEEPPCDRRGSRSSRSLDVDSRRARGGVLQRTMPCATAGAWRRAARSLRLASPHLLFKSHGDGAVHSLSIGVRMLTVTASSAADSQVRSEATRASLPASPGVLVCWRPIPRDLARVCWLRDQ
jgi:hypothetical protein